VRRVPAGEHGDMMLLVLLLLLLLGWATIQFGPDESLRHRC
jgi:hypothetical protein